MHSALATHSAYFRSLAVRVLMLAFASLGAGCQQAGGREASLRVQVWCPVVPSLSGVWGADGSDAFAVGESGTVFRSDGSGWRESEIQSEGCWPDPNCAHPHIHHYSLFSDVWGSSRNDVFVVYEDQSSASLIHFDGANWEDLPYHTVIDAEGHRLWPNFDFFDRLRLHAVWGNSVSDVFAVGDSGAIIHFDGHDWRKMDSPESRRLNSVWGISPVWVFAVGEEGVALLNNGRRQLDGMEWTPVTSGTTYSLHRVWGSAPDEMFAVGDHGTIVHWTGLTARLMASGTSEDLYGVWGSSPNDVFAVGHYGTIVHYDGSSWSLQTSGIETRDDGNPVPPRHHDLKGVWGTSGSNVFAVGDDGTILHYDGSSWSIQSLRVRVVLTRSNAAPDERVISCFRDGILRRGHRELDYGTTFNYRIANEERWTVNGELLSYAGTVVGRASNIATMRPSSDEEVDFDFDSSQQPSTGSVVLRWTLNGSQPSDDLHSLCRNFGADKVIATANGGHQASADCGLGALEFTELSAGAVPVAARLVDSTGNDVAPPQDVAVQVVPGAAIDAHVDFQIRPVTGSCEAAGTRHDNPNITTSETWLASDSPHHVLGRPVTTVSNGAVLGIQPGSTVCLGGALRFEGGARLVAGYNSGPRVTFTGDYVSPSVPHRRWNQIQLFETPSVRSTITNAIIEYSSDGIINAQTHPLTIDHTLIRMVTNTPALVLFAGDSRVISSTIDATGSSGSRAVVELFPLAGITFESRVMNAPGDAVQINGIATLRRCEIIGSVRDGVRFLTNTIHNMSVTGCNLEGNRGLAINNTSLSPVNADDNWWDPPGDGHSPAIGSPNGISENVTVTRVRSSKVTLDY